MQSMMKNRQDNDVIDHTIMISKKYNTELSRSIGQNGVYDEDDTRQ